MFLVVFGTNSYKKSFSYLQDDAKYRPYFVKMVQPTKYQFYKGSKKMAPFYMLQMLGELGRHPQPILVILEEAVVSF
jgi:hypothetical protein